MAYKLSGKVMLVSDTVSLSSKSGTQFTKRDLVITVRKFDQYTGVPSDDDGNTPKFTFMGLSCQQLDGIKVGDIVTELFDIAGRSYEKDGKTEYYTDVRPFKVELQRQSYQQPQAASQTPQDPFAYPQQTNQTDMQTAPQAAPTTAQVQTDDLPF